MYDLFLTIAEITLAMTPLLALAWVFTRQGKRFSAGCRYAVWCILLLRLAIPLNFSLPTPVLDLAPPALPRDEAVETLPPQTIPQLELPDVTPTAPPVSDPIEPPAPTLDIDPTKALPIVWLLGALAVLGRQLAGHGMAAARLRRWMIPATEPRLTDALSRAKAHLGMRRPVRLWLCAEVSSPMLRGLISPEILLPHGDYSDEQLDAILTHELIHCRRGDLWWKLAAMAATSLHFFNPLVHMAAREMEIEMEQACDDAVFRCDEVSRHSYAETMLAVARQGLATPQRGLNTHFHGPAKALKGRFANILDSSAKRAGVGIIAATLVVALLIGALVSCRTEAGPGDENAIIAAADAALDNAWQFERAYVILADDRATLSARHTQDGTEAWADLVLVREGKGWIVTAGENGTRNRRDDTAEAFMRQDAFTRRSRSVADLLAARFGEDTERAEHLNELAWQHLAQLERNEMQLHELEQKFAQAMLTVNAHLEDSLAGAIWPLGSTGRTLPSLELVEIDGVHSLLFTAPVGTKVVAAQAGTVLEAGYDSTDGNYVILSHGDMAFTRYAHLAEVKVKANDKVSAQQQLGLVGCSGITETDGTMRMSAYVKGSPFDASALYLDQIRQLTSLNHAPADTTDPAVEIGTDTTAPAAPFSYFSLYAPIATENYLSVDNSADTYLRYTPGYRAPVFAPAAGEVIGITDEAGGFSVTIRHENGFTIRLTGLDSVAVTAGTALESSAYLGQAATPVTLYLNDAAGQAIDPETYLHWPRKIDYVYRPHDSLPILHSWSNEIGNYLSDFAVGILGNHHNMLSFVLEALYGEAHDFGQLSLTTSQLTADGKTYRCVWRAHRGSRGYVSFAVDNDMRILVSEDGRTWHRLAITEKGAFPAADAIMADPSAGGNPLFPYEVWFVTDPANSVVLTGIATVYVEPTVPRAPVTTSPNSAVSYPTTGEITAEPVQTSKVGSEPGDLHHYWCDDIMPIDAVMTGDVWRTVSREYDILLAYIRKTYPGEKCDALYILPIHYEGYAHVWEATVGERKLTFPINEDGGFLVGQYERIQIAEPKMFSTPTIDGMPSGTVYLNLAEGKPQFPWRVTFPVE